MYGGRRGGTQLHRDLVEIGGECSVKDKPSIRRPPPPRRFVSYQATPSRPWSVPHGCALRNACADISDDSPRCRETSVDFAKSLCCSIRQQRRAGCLPAPGTIPISQFLFLGRAPR